jgi:shikimate dehydrogenase
VLGVIGRPVSGSWSPRVLGMALKAARLDAVYLAFEPSATLAGFLELADDECFRGFSVTAPFKEEAFALAAQRDGVSDIARACNTLVRDGNRWRGSNTDAPAVRETLERAWLVHAQKPGKPETLAKAHTLVLGTGGAARAVVAAVVGAGGRVTVAGRDVGKARKLAAELSSKAIAAIAWSDVPRTEHDALVHATPLGSTAAPDELPIPADWIRPGSLVLDAVYRPLRTPLLVAAVERGCTAVPGGEWFVRQAVLQFQELTRAEPNEDLMRQAFAHAHEDGERSRRDHADD